MERGSNFFPFVIPLPVVQKAIPDTRARAIRLHGRVSISRESWDCRTCQCERRACWQIIRSAAPSRCSCDSRRENRRGCLSGLCSETTTLWKQRALRRTRSCPPSCSITWGRQTTRAKVWSSELLHGESARLVEVDRPAVPTPARSLPVVVSSKQGAVPSLRRSAVPVAKQRNPHTEHAAAVAVTVLH